MEKLRAKYLRLLGTVKTKTKRFLYDQINWNDRLIIIKGQRGTGKTTLLLQHIKNIFRNLEETLYVTLDDIYFSDTTLSKLIEDFSIDGGKYLFLDEIHKYKGWSQELKNIYDFYPDINIVVTGSSALSFYIHQADLGRRASVYDLPELSFREYLYFTQDITFNMLKLNDIIENHESIARKINSKIKSVRSFREYLRTGAYPFVLEGANKYYDKVESLIITVIDSDIPAIENINYESRMKLKKLLLMMASSSPFKLNVSELSRKLETTRDVLIKYLNLLNQAGIIRFLTTEGIGHTIIRKPDKIYFSNSNLMFAICDDADTGTVRETFFLSQLSNNHRVAYSKNADFLINSKYTFEIGGKSKSFKQIKNLNHAFLAVDDLEYGYKNKIPLWLFGFLY